MKKYKENSQLNLPTYAKYFLSFFLILFVCIIVYVFMEIDDQSFSN